jgi:sec-independent protein translocase protein TatB
MPAGRRGSCWAARKASEAVFDIGTPELLLLIVIAVILFGPERLPDLARRAARMIRYIRRMAANAQEQLKEELGPDFSDLDVRDLHPKTFVQKHLLNEVEPILADVKKDLVDAREALDGAEPVSPSGPQDVATTTSAPARASTPFDTDAT